MPTPSPTTPPPIIVSTHDARRLEALVQAPGAADDDVVAALEAELARAELREALLTRRNRAWADTIGAMLAEGRKPLVAVGAAHMAPPQGLPELLTAMGYTVRRVR